MKRIRDDLHGLRRRRGEGGEGMKYIHDGNISADRIVELIAAHSDALKTLREQLPEVCEREGHRWSRPEQDFVSEQYPEYGAGFCGAGLTGRYVTEQRCGYIRRCGRCGKVEQRDAIPGNPFDESNVAAVGARDGK